MGWEAEMKSILKWVLGLYVVVAIITMVMQVEIRRVPGPADAD
jgi:hypothetical protein